MVRCLAIGGSDCSGGAGVEADLAIFHDAAIEGCSVITALTAQTARQIYRIEPSPLPQITATFAAVAELQPIAAIKTGMLVDSERVQTIATAIARHFADTPLVVDPVSISSSGSELLSPAGVEALTHHLFPLATLITPNLDEAERLLGGRIVDCKSAASALAQQFNCAVLLKGGHGSEPTVTDTLVLSSGEMEQWQFPRQQMTATAAHGTGCRVAATIAAALALEMPLCQAVPRAHHAATTGRCLLSLRA
ncbi:MAG: hydroxymethylpyrimidine/phosphomethylpyrimidine kinase [Mariprofundales bacterium]|nr:hydroxymethylpyrimidine/phosphomethylpyrimidine kinase [Mariprofundales bacterium]